VFKADDSLLSSVELVLLLVISSLVATGTRGAVGPRTVLVGWSLCKLAAGKETLRTETVLQFEVLASAACYVAALVLRAGMRRLLCVVVARLVRPSLDHDRQASLRGLVEPYVRPQ
tara:strand:- start:120 stop:467 length:348 start_codon:yes stop_codon:yes gene_type:complete